jgi:WD40 repeat protein
MDIKELFGQLLVTVSGVLFLFVMAITPSCHGKRSKVQGAVGHNYHHWNDRSKDGHHFYNLALHPSSAISDRAGTFSLPLVFSCAQFSVDEVVGQEWSLTNQELISAQSRYLVTGAADNSLRLWDVSTGKCLYTWEFLTAVKRVAWR